jgi:anthranilate/para-aminobenzoate synthase component II
MEKMYHGVATQLNLLQSHFLFKGISSNARFGLYHSWALKNLPETLAVIALSTDNEIMCIQHREKPFCGVQFHPESYLSDSGDRVLKNWIDSICQVNVLDNL